MNEDDIKRVAEEVASILIHSTRSITLEDRLAIQCGSVVAFATMINDDEHQVLFQARMRRAPVAGEIVFDPNGRRYRVTNVRYEFTPLEMEPGVFDCHAIVCLFPTPSE